MSASDNIEQQYDAVIGYLDGYRSFVGTINARAPRTYMRNPILLYQFMKKFPTIWRQINPLSGRNPQFNREFSVESATPNERGNEYYPMVISNYPTHELSLGLEARYADFDFEKIKKFHELRKNQVARVNSIQIVGVVLGAATLLLKSLPESVVKRVMDYQRFELIIFLVASATIVYLLLGLFPMWMKYNRAKKLAEYAGDVLEYTVIRLASGSRPPPSSPGIFF